MTSVKRMFFYSIAFSKFIENFFFNRGEDQLNSLQIMYVAFGISLVGVIIISLLPEKKAIKWLTTYPLFGIEREEYDWLRTLKNHRRLLLATSLCSLLFIILGHIFGLIATNIGLGVLCIVILTGTYFADPKKVIN